MERFTRSLVVLAILTSALAPLAASQSTAHACGCVPDAMSPTNLRYADTVFAGTAIDVEEWDGQGSSATPLTATFNVDTRWLGDPPARTVVRTAASGASCGYTFEEGTRYIVYARASEVTTERRFDTSLCSPTTPYNASTVAALESVAGPGTPVAGVPTSTAAPAVGSWSDRGKVLASAIALIAIAAVATQIPERRSRP